jgi:hypothetical protein
MRRFSRLLETNGRKSAMVIAGAADLVRGDLPQDERRLDQIKAVDLQFHVYCLRQDYALNETAIPDDVGTEFGSVNEIVNWHSGASRILGLNPE